MILDDFETYSELEGCVIYDVPDDWDAEQVHHYLRADDDERKVVAIFDFYTMLRIIHEEKTVDVELPSTETV